MHFVQAKGILSQNNGMNIYRGCSHGCIYCDSRSKCYGFTHAFADIEVKGNAPELLEQALRSKRHRCMIGTGAMSDPYLPAEKELRLTRKCLELIDQYEYGVTVLTKASLVLRDLDLLQSIIQKAKAVLEEILHNDEDTKDDKGMVRFVDELGENAVIMGLRVWVATDKYWSIKWRLNQLIKEAFDANGIEIPYNQVHVKEESRI